MRKLLLASAIYLFCYSYLQGDDSAKLANNIVVFQQGFVIESLSGYGFSSSTIFPIYNISSGNPAMISNFSKPSLGVSYQYNSQIDSFALDITFQRANNLIPQSAGFVYPVQNLGLGVGFSQKYSSELRVENIVIVDPQSPAGYSEYATAVEKNAIYSISTLASYQFINLLSKADRLSFGAQIDINLLRKSQSISGWTTKLSDEAVNWKFGVGYMYNNPSIESLQFGITYESKINFSGYYESNRPLITPPTSAEFVQIPATLTYPAKLKLGFLLESPSRFGIYNDFTYNFWENMNSYHKNKLDISGGIVVRASSEISASLGYYLFESYVNDEISSPIHSDAVFIFGGLILKYGQFDLHFVLADSHLFSGERSKQTIGKMGLGFNL